MHRAVSEGIATLAHQGRITATSAMVLSPHWQQDVGLLKPLRNRIDVGLHLDWTSDFAHQAGHGLTLAGALLACALRRISARQARPVIERQLDAFESAWQAPPDHVDGHQHVQQFPGIRDALVQLMTERYGSAGKRPYLRISKLPAGTADFKAQVIAAMGAEPLRNLAQKRGLPAAPALAGVYDFGGDLSDYDQRMQAWLNTSPAGTLLMCHPGLALSADQTAQEPHDPIAAARQREYHYLASAPFQARLQSQGIELVRGSDLYSF